MKTLIVAFGGNALIKDGQKGTAKEQFENLKTPLSQIAHLSKTFKIILTHGNGPQVGNLLLQQASNPRLPQMPLEILVAQTQGQIGYMIEQTLDNEFMNIGIDTPLITTILTYVYVDRNDPAFDNPTKPVGPSYKTQKKGYVLTPKGWRKVVPSPQPQKIIEWREIKTLIDNGFIVIACGGGGIPVTAEYKRFEGIEAVIDKDLASAKLGEQIEADILLIATDVEKVAINFQKPNQAFLDTVTIAEAQKYLQEGHFLSGSMGPKVQAALNFLQSGDNKRAIITSIDKLQHAIDGQTGTHFIRE